MSSRAGSMPPITSTTRSIDGSATTAWASRVEHTLGQIDIALAAEVADGHRTDLEAHTGASLDRRLLRHHQVDERGTDVAASQYTDPHELCHGRKATG